MENKTVVIRCSTGVVHYGINDVRWEVRDEIIVAVQAGETSGRIECGGQRYDWSLIDAD